MDFSNENRIGRNTNTWQKVPVVKPCRNHDIRPYLLKYILKTLLIYPVPGGLSEQGHPKILDFQIDYMYFGAYMSWRYAVDMRDDYENVISFNFGQSIRLYNCNRLNSTISGYAFSGVNNFHS